MLIPQTQWGKEEAERRHQTVGQVSFPMSAGLTGFLDGLWSWSLSPALGLGLTLMADARLPLGTGSRAWYMASGR